MSTKERRAYAFPRFGIQLGWAYIRHKATPLSQPWFAAQLAELIHSYAQSSKESRPLKAFYIGHLLAQMEAKGLLKSVQRGKLTKASASKAGLAKSAVFASTRDEILFAMAPLIESGHSVANAGRIAYQRGFGTSAGANRKLWSRWMKTQQGDT